MATQVLLIEDVEDLGHKGELVNVRPGYFRNFLSPQGLAVTATARELRNQAKLQEERRQRAIVDKKESDEIAARIEGITVTATVKVDQEGHMYGSVTTADLVPLIFEVAKVQLDKKSIQLKHAIKEIGEHSVQVKLKEGVKATFQVKVEAAE